MWDRATAKQSRATRRDLVSWRRVNSPRCIASPSQQPVREVALCAQLFVPTERSAGRGDRAAAAKGTPRSRGQHYYAACRRGAPEIDDTTRLPPCRSAVAQRAVPPFQLAVAALAVRFRDRRETSHASPRRCGAPPPRPRSALRCARGPVSRLRELAAKSHQSWPSAVLGRLMHRRLRRARGWHHFFRLLLQSLTHTQ
jgi:hypothetical protein